MALITFEDKVAIRESNLPRKNSVTADDLNEIKTVVNANASGGGGSSEYFWTVELIDYTSISARAPFNLKATSIDMIDFNPSVTITVNGFPLVLGDPINKGATIAFSTPNYSVFNFIFEKIV